MPVATHVLPYLIDQPHDVERLLHRSVSTQKGEILARKPLAAEDENRQLLEARLITQTADDLIACHAGHVLVEEHQRRPLLARKVDCLGTGLGCDGVEAKLLEKIAHQHENRTV